MKKQVFNLGPEGLTEAKQKPSLSKFARVVDVFSRRLQVQEKLTFEIHHAICKVLGTEDVEVTTEAKHLCMMMRGVQKQCSTTSCVERSGIFFRMNK